MSRLARRVRNAAPVPYTNSSGTPGSSLSGLFNGRFGNPKQSMEAYNGVSTLHAIVSRIANSTSLVQWDLWRLDPSGDPALRTKVTNHPAWTVWQKPNRFFTRQELVEGGQQHLDLTGEGWCVVEYVPGTSLPCGLWPVRPDRIEPVPSSTEYLAGYLYHGPDGEKIPLGLNEVIFLRMPNPLDSYRGAGPVQSLLMTLDSIKYSQAWNRNFFVNSAEPGGVVEIASNLSDAEFDQFNLRWNEQHRGVAKAHRVALLEGGAKWVSNAVTQRDMQFVELQTVSRDTVIEAFGMPRSVLGITENVNLANALAGKTDFADLTVRPRLERWKSALNNDFLPLYGAIGTGLEFDYQNPIPKDPVNTNETTKVNSAMLKVLIEAGYDPEEALVALNMPPIAWIGPTKVTPAPIGAPA